MTTLGLEYLKLKESERAAKAKEMQARHELSETRRANLANENIKAMTLDEARRANTVNEIEIHRSNMARELENYRSNTARERENTASRKADVRLRKEANQINRYNAVTNRQKSDESKRHNKANEIIDAVDTGRKVYDTGVLGTIDTLGQLFSKVVNTVNPLPD